ncbi:MAG: phosphoribosylformylglycinamidine cyclo-ligase, partial [Pirellulaceae bacterium]|nr:phosphoribosylformylglycinamidine cyclo-ligase [Pirellulaceae bacterium]
AVDLVFDKSSWQIPPLFQWLQQLGDVPEEEMFHVFNMGVGLVFIVNPYYAGTVHETARSLGLKSWVVGNVEAGSGKSRWL